MMKMSLRQEVMLLCAICDHPYHETELDEDRIAVSLLGAVPYAQCPGCGRIVSDSNALFHDPEYRRRARARHFERTGRAWLSVDDAVPHPVSNGGWRKPR